MKDDAGQWYRNHVAREESGCSLEHVCFTEGGGELYAWINNSVKMIASGNLFPDSSDSIESRRRRHATSLVREPLRVAPAPQPVPVWWGPETGVLYGALCMDRILDGVHGQIDNAFAHDLLRLRAAVGRPRGQRRRR